jgi:hypothetical protein
MIAHPDSNRWQSLATVYSAKTRSPLVEVIRIEGENFATKEAAYSTVSNWLNGG